MNNNQPKFISDNEADSFFGTSPNVSSQPKFIPDNQSDSFFGTTPLKPTNQPQFNVPDIETRQQKIARYNSESADLAKKSKEANSVLGFAKNFGKAVVSNIAAPEVALGNTIAKLDSKPRQTYLDSIQQTDAIQANLLKQIRINKAAGKDTTKLEQLYNAGQKQVELLQGGLNEANTLPTQKQAAGQLAGTALDILSAGTYGKAKTVGMQSFKLAPKTSVVQKVAAVVPELSQVAKQKASGLFSRKGIANVTKGGILGYTSDVTMNAQNNEDNIYKAGVGTIIGTSIPVLSESVQTIKNLKNPEKYIKAESKAWEVPIKEKSAKYDNAKVIQERANVKGIDLQKELVLNQDFAKVNSTKGKLDTLALSDRYKTKAADIGKIDITPAIKEVDYAVKSEPISNIFDEAKTSLKQNLTATDEAAVLNYLNKEEKLLNNKFKAGTLKPSDIYTYKKIYSGSAGYKKGFAGDAIAEQGNTILDKVLKDKLVKIGDQTGLPINDLFKLQEKNYLIADYVKSLDGTKIPLTGIQKARKTSLKLTGAFLGNKAGGLFGAAAGYNAAGAIDEALSNFPAPFRKSILESIQNETPEAQQKLINFLKMNANTKLNMRALPAPTTIYQGPTQGGKPYTPNSTGFKTNPVVETYSSFPRNETSPINMNIEPKKTNIPQTILPIKKSGKQSGFIKNPLVSKMKIHSEDLGEMRDFLDVQTGAYKPSEKMILDNEIAVRRYVEDKFGKNTDNLNPKALARYIGPIVDKYYGK